MSFLKSLNHREIAALINDWRVWARDDQLPPSGDWLSWIFMGGRGAGKTRAGAEWVRGLIEGWSGFSEKPVKRIALIGETLADVRDVMIEGDSGILAVCRWSERPRWVSSKRQLVWPNGAIAMCFSSEDPESLRGPQFEAAWCDEVGKWTYAEETFDMLQFGLRLGQSPRQMITTTPRSTPLMKRILNSAQSVVTHARTYDNRHHLALGFLRAVEEQYGSSRLGRQELDGELIEDRADALWSRAMMEATRVQAVPELQRVVVAVDPPASSHKKSDACGIVVAGLCESGTAYVLEDATVEAARPEVWAARAVDVYERYIADRVVAEANQGGEMVETVLRMVEPTLAISLVHASRGKHVRAEPVAALYARGRVKHVGGFAQLEDQMSDFGLDGLSGGRSPDRLDALVWAITELLLHKSGAPKIRVL